METIKKPRNMNDIKKSSDPDLVRRIISMSGELGTDKIHPLTFTILQSQGVIPLNSPERGPDGNYVPYTFADYQGTRLSEFLNIEVTPAVLPEHANDSLSVMLSRGGTYEVDGFVRYR